MHENLQKAVPKGRLFDGTQRTALLLETFREKKTEGKKRS